MRLALNICIIAAIVLAEFAVFGTLDKVTGDVNGDQRVNICDLQLSISKILTSSGAKGPEKALSILDFARSLAQAKKPSSSPVPVKPIHREGFWGTQPVPKYRPSTLPVLSCHGPASAPNAGTPQPTEVVLPRKLLERHLKRLTPHAPPVLG